MAATRSKKGATPVFDHTKVSEAPRYHWREIDREDREPLRVKLLDLSNGQVKAIPYDRTTPLDEVYAVIAPYVVEWDLRAIDQESGQEMDVPPPAEYGPEVLDIIDTATGVSIVAWLKNPGVMQAAQDRERDAGK